MINNTVLIDLGEGDIIQHAGLDSADHPTLLMKHSPIKKSPGDVVDLPADFFERPDVVITFTDIPALERFIDDLKQLKKFAEECKKKMSERQEKKKRYNRRLEFIALFEKWLNSEPSMIHIFKWRRWKNSRPIWEETHETLDV